MKMRHRNIKRPEMMQLEEEQKRGQVRFVRLLESRNVKT